MHVMWENRIRRDDGDQLVDGDQVGRKLRVLVVDDDRDTAVSFSFVCRLWGYETEFCSEGIEAMQAAAPFQPDVFLLDIAMPRIDGYALALKLRDLPGCADAVFVAISGYADASHRTKGLDCGFDHYLIKPVESSVLHALLQGCEKTAAEPRATLSAFA